MKSLPRLLVAVVATLLSVSAVHAQDTVKVAFLAPNPPDNPFWGTMYKVMRATAADLDIDLEFHYSKSNTYSFRKDGDKILSAADKPDYFITGYWNGVTAGHLKTAESRRIKTFIINTAISENERRLVGKPRTQFEHWIGHIRPDDRQAGYDLAATLIGAAESGDVGQIEMLVLGGSADSNVTVQRENGAVEAARRSGLPVEIDKVQAMWEIDVARRAVEKATTDRDAVNVVWAASDTMALGAVEALQTTGQTPGRDVFVGGIDWTQAGMEAVAAGDMTASYGGHFMEGAWALILIYDHHHGNDFAGETGVSFFSSMQPITADNVAAYRKAFDNEAWDTIDFSELSRTLNPEFKGYNFDPAILLTGN